MQPNIARQYAHTSHYLCVCLVCFINSLCQWGGINSFFFLNPKAAWLAELFTSSFAKYVWTLVASLLSKGGSVFSPLTNEECLYLKKKKYYCGRTPRTVKQVYQAVAIFLVVLKTEKIKPWFKGLCVCLLEKHSVVMLWYKSSCRAKQILWIDVVLWLWVPSKLAVPASSGNPVRE